MSKLFDDSLFIQKQRPTRITEMQEEKMFIDLAKDCIEQQFSSDDIDIIAKDFKDLYRNDSGYEKAKDLENNGSGSYNINGEFIDWLDWLDYKRNEILSENIKLWVNAHKPKNKFEKGIKLKVIKTMNHTKKEGSIVYVTGIREEEANYLIDEDKDKRGGQIICFEKIEANCELIK